MFIRKGAFYPVAIGLASVGILAAGWRVPFRSEDKILKRLTPDDAGHEVAIKMDERFEVALPEISTSGYLWTVHKADPDHLKLEWEGYDGPETDRARVGARRTKLFVFQALKEGTTKLELWRRRPWDDPDKYVEAFKISLKIQPL